MTDFAFTEADHMAVASATKILVAQFRPHVEYADVQQELYVWLLAKYDRAERWREEHSERHAERTLIKALRNAGSEYCRAQKAHRLGYSPDDEFFYSLPMIADLLQLHLSEEGVPPDNGAPSRHGRAGRERARYFREGSDHDSGLGYAASQAPGRTSGGKPLSERGDLIAMVADVARAYAALPVPDRTLLARVYDGSSDPADAIACEALDWDVTHDAAYMRIRRVLGRLRANLGGAAPYGNKEYVDA